MLLLWENDFSIFVQKINSKYCVKTYRVFFLNSCKYNSDIVSNSHFGNTSGIRNIKTNLSLCSNGNSPTCYFKTFYQNKAILYFKNSSIEIILTILLLLFFKLKVIGIIIECIFQLNTCKVKGICICITISI